MDKIKVECQVCATTYTLPAVEWQRYSEEHFSDTDHSQPGYICTECEDFQPGPQEEDE